MKSNQSYVDSRMESDLLAAFHVLDPDTRKSVHTLVTSAARRRWTSDPAGKLAAMAITHSGEVGHA